MVEEGLNRWLKVAPKIEWWTSSRPLRTGSDCSGLATPELALKAYADHHNKQVDVAFSCDIATPCQKWIHSLGFTPIFKNMLARVFKGKVRCILGRTTKAELLKVESSLQNELDLYICGFMCNPWSKNGRRLGWKDENSKPFFAALKTVLALRVRVAIFENVCDFESKSNDVLAEAFATLSNSGYVPVTLHLNSADHHIPQDRERLYIVVFRADALRRPFKGSSSQVLQQYILGWLEKARAPRESFLTWLAQVILFSCWAESENLKDH